MPDLPPLPKAEPCPGRPTVAEIERAAAIIATGGMVVFPTHGLYGLGADAGNPRAVERVFRLKGRLAQKPFLVLISDRKMLSALVKTVPSMAEQLMQRFWPGRLTLVLDARSDLPAGICSPSGKIGVRWVAHPVALALVRAVGRPITGTSANLSGERGCAAVAQIPQKVLAGVDLVLDAGVLAGGAGSTVVDVTGPAPLILRPGALAESDIMAALVGG